MGAGMNGWELVEHARRRYPRLRIVLATGWGAGLDPAEARSRGVDVVVAKPYRPEELERALAA
jgi:CheY-like chemotaxis protein